MSNLPKDLISVPGHLRQVSAAAYETVNELYKSYEMVGWTLPWIVCAANRIKFINEQGHVETIVIAGARHSCETMLVAKARVQGRHVFAEEGLRDVHYGLPSDDRNHFLGEDQGFIDQHDRFYTRAEAYVVASRNNQIRRQADGWPAGILCSEQLY